MEIDYLRQWIGRSESCEERIAPFPANALAATLDRDDPPYGEGDALPPLWHWLHFLPVFRLSEAGRDGHPALGGFLPPVSLPRRMWAGGRLHFHAPLRIGERLRKTSTVTDVDHKRGRSGDLVFVTVQHSICARDAVAVEEWHDIVYREEAADGVTPVLPTAAPENADFSRVVRPDPVLLFRYSALTFNGHRIHYDQPFCIGSEGYAGLVVHGPLLATMLLDLVRREQPEASIAAFRFRALATVLDTHAFSLNGRREDAGALRLWVRRDDGAMAMEGLATLTGREG